MFALYGYCSSHTGSVVPLVLRGDFDHCKVLRTWQLELCRLEKWAGNSKVTKIKKEINTSTIIFCAQLLLEAFGTFC